ncbi:hypothetical protein [Rhodococcus sp. ACPA1]|uniref:hypothetical protein n=1 Tax=Rhodococcus sp. ACPA1 TaxID=2028572 RepID=UPI000BB0DB21|nr:hypothetical protein [Rhodococcus sp. ACPA1]PBC54899.1 hypothetical protein CJ177_17975 [Rhodococcus sp. ACPA1]
MSDNDRTINVIALPPGYEAETIRRDGSRGATIPIPVVLLQEHYDPATGRTRTEVLPGAYDWLTGAYVPAERIPDAATGRPLHVCTPTFRPPAAPARATKRDGEPTRSTRS